MPSMLTSFLFEFDSPPSSAGRLPKAIPVAMTVKASPAVTGRATFQDDGGGLHGSSDDELETIQPVATASNAKKRPVSEPDLIDSDDLSEPNAKIAGKNKLAKPAGCYEV
jgi:hypothetical protein